MAKVYNADKTSYKETDASGKTMGGGLAGTESWGSSGGGNLGDITSPAKATLGRSGGGSSRSDYAPQQSNITDQVESLKNAQLTASMAALDKSRNASLSNLSAERATIEPLYQKEKMQAGVTAKQTARSFAEYMAQRGGGAGASGIGGQGELLNNMAYQKQYGELGQAETGALTENARQVSNVNNAYASDSAAASANVESQYLQNYITQMNADRAYNQQNKQFEVSSNQAQQQITNQASQFAQSFGMSQQQFAETIKQNGIANVMQDKQFAQSVDQFSQQMGLSREQYASSLDQWAKSFAQSGSQFDRTLELQKAQLASSNANAAANRAAKSITQSSPQGKTNMDNAMIEIDNQLGNGTSPGNVANAIEQQRSSLAKQGINVDSLIKSVWEKSGLQTKPEAEDSWR